MIVDFRSDTVTKPSKDMKDFMFNAEVGDDVFEEDPTINELEQFGADMFGMEAGLYCSSGTQTNQIAIKAHTNPGDEVICHEEAHIYRYEGGGMARNCQVSARFLRGNSGRINPLEIEDNINPDNLHYPVTTLVSIEDTANRGGGTIYDFNDIKLISKICKKNNLSIPELMMKNELIWRSEDSIKSGVLKFWEIMEDCVSRGFKNEGTLPGGLNVLRRAPNIYKNLTQNPEKNLSDVLSIMDWVNLYALAVNEENAAGGKVITAPTNGAAGIIPSVLHYFVRFSNKYTEQGVIDFLLTAAAIAILYKKNASISGAEVGCQGEVGVACSMAAGALTQVMGGTIDQVENAAEIAMEHNLGLTCDPIGGLVQIPCIERNAMGAIKAINAAELALETDPKEVKVPLDKVIDTMWETAKDMNRNYKETSEGGLAITVRLADC